MLEANIVFVQTVSVDYKKNNNEVISVVGLG